MFVLCPDEGGHYGKDDQFIRKVGLKCYTVKLFYEGFYDCI